MQYRFDIDPSRTFHSGKPANAAAVADFLIWFKANSFIATLAAPVASYAAAGGAVVGIGVLIDQPIVILIGIIGGALGFFLKEKGVI